MKQTSPVIVVPFFVFLFLLSACLHETPSNRSLEPSPYTSANINPNPNIVLRTDRDTYPESTESAELIIENQTNEKIEYGTSWQIETLQNGKWVQIPFRDNIAITLIGIVLSPGQADQITLPFSGDMLKVSLAKGTYRIIKNIDGGIYAAEFRIIDS